jgi:hypothetical protein
MKQQVIHLTVTFGFVFVFIEKENNAFLFFSRLRQTGLPFRHSDKPGSGPFQWVPRINWPGHESGLSPALSAEVNTWK